MDFDPDPGEVTFRQEVRSFLEANLPPDMARRGRRAYTHRRDDMLRWQEILAKGGYGVPEWSAAAGGRGWTGRQRMIFDQELARADAPAVNVQGLTLVAPVLREFGTPEQKKRFLEPLIAGKTIWCQGFSEPGAGSDLAALRTAATRVESGWKLSGQKIWTSQAHMADWCFILARTSIEARKQQGISFFLMDMKQPGIDVRPIISIDDQHHLNEVFLNEAFVPDGQLVGEEGQGWAIAKFLLNNERLFGSADMPSMYRSLARVRRIAESRSHRGRPLIENPAFRRKLARLEIQVQVIEFKLMATAAKEDISERELSIVGSAIKIRATETYMALMTLAVEALGDDGAVLFPDPEGEEAWPEPPAPAYAEGTLAEYFFSRAASIYGGTNEIQRNIIAKSRFGL